jgi:hypothetical protein
MYYNKQVQNIHSTPQLGLQRDFSHQDQMDRVHMKLLTADKLIQRLHLQNNV